MRDIFSEHARLESWLAILAALANAQAEHGIIPSDAASQIASLTVDSLDLDLVVEETRTTSHSTLGIIRALERSMPSDAAQWAYYGATVQDVTDTWTSLTARSVGRIVWRDLRAIEASLLELAVRHRDQVMAGRTHGQIGSPVTLGFKVAGWADEVRRHIHRLAGGRERWLVGQLAGSVGTMPFLGGAGRRIRDDFCALLGLGSPTISWTSSRDRLAEFVGVLALIGNTLARIGDEVFELQRSEIGELAESASSSSVGSITMPHKSNPEGSEHLVTLGRLIRANAAVVLDSSIQIHERDGRGWKAEWVAFPEVCLLTGVALSTAGTLVDGLSVNQEAMARNLAATRGFSASELALVAASGVLGKHDAHRRLYAALRRGVEEGLDLEASIRSDPALDAVFDRRTLDEVLAAVPTGSAGAMVDDVVARARAERAVEPDVWA